MTANSSDPIPCPMCGSESAADSAFCSVCGYDLRAARDNAGGCKCARCGSLVPSGFSFCPVCGLDQRRRLSRPVTEVVSIDGAVPEGDPTLPEDGSHHHVVHSGAPVGSLTVPAPGRHQADPPTAPAAPMPPAQTGRTVFMDGPPLPRPPMAGDDDRTVPVPGKAPPREPMPDPRLASRDLEAELARPAEPWSGAVIDEAPPTLPGDPSGQPWPPAPSSETLGAPDSVQDPGTPVHTRMPTPRLVLVARDGEERESFAFAGETMSLGRTQGDVVFADDPFMSPMHARVERSGEAYTLVDMGSTNGVYLRIRGSAPVYPGDLFMVGHQVLRLDNVVESVQEQPPGPDGTRVFGTPLKPAWGKLVLVGRGGVPGNVYFLRGAKVVFGRERGDLLFPADPFVSREHARLRLELQGGAMGVFLEDLGSANGTYIRIRGSVEIRGRDTFRIGDQILRLRLDP